VQILLKVGMNKQYSKKPINTYKNLNQSNEKSLTKMYVGNMDYEMDEGDINRLFRKYGKIGKIQIIRDPKTNRSKGIAFFQMFNPEHAQEAIKAVNGRIVNDRTLKVSIALEREKEKAPAKRIKRRARKLN
jgi:RNA recognition motif-containing protein